VKQRLLETFENFDVGRVIARHPFETVGGFLAGFASAASMTVMWLTPGLQPLAAIITTVGLAWSTVNSFIVYSQTGSAIEALTVSPFGIVVAPIRAIGDPTMDDSMRASIIGAMVGVPLGVFVGRQIALDVAMLRMPGELRNNPKVYGRLYGIEEKWGTPLACSIADSMGRVYQYLDVPDPEDLITLILSDALKSRREAFYIASMLKWMAETDKGFLSQHAGNLMEYLGSPLLRLKLSSLLSLSPEEALSLSQSVSGDFTRMLRLAEFKAAWEQLAKLGPDVARILSISTEGIEVGVEKSLAGKLYPGIQKGTVVEFEFARGSIAFKGMLAYAGEKTVGEGSYMVFAFKAEERIPAILELLSDDIQSIRVVPGSQVEKSFGLNAFRLSDGKLSMDRGILGMDGSVRFADGSVLRLDNPSVMLVPSENPLETWELNKMLLGGRIGETSMVVGEDGVAKAFHGGSYLPAVVTASSLGFQLGLLARPSGETLTITQMDLTQRGIIDPGLLSIFYPSGETSMVIYTGKDLQAPLFSYSSGAFVGIQAVETRVVWTSVDKKAFYEQVASVSGLLGSILGSDFKEELLKAILVTGLTDAQALDVANTLARNVEWLKTLSRGRRMELVRKITDYVKKGDTAEEAVERAKKESEEYVKNIENEIAAFYSSILISDAQLAKEVLELIDCVKRNLGYDAAKWLLDVLKKVYGKALNSSGGNREVANAKLRDVVEKAFRYPESTLEGCALASAIVSEMREKSIEQASEELNRIANYPEGLRVKAVLRKEGDRFRIYLSKTLLASYLGDEACWVKIEVKGRTIYREYKPAYNYFNLPEDIGEDGEEVGITIKKITTYDFIKATIKGAGAPFDIVPKLGRYWLIVNGKQVCEMLLENDLHYDKGDYGPAVIFAIRSHGNGKEMIKLVYRESIEYVCKVMISHFRRIKSIEYKEDWNMLLIEYFEIEGKEASWHKIYLEDPKSVLVRKILELIELIKKGDEKKASGLEGDIGEWYVEHYRREDIKRKISEILGLLADELEVKKRPTQEGPDFYVYYKGELKAVIEVKSTRKGEKIKDRMDAGKRQLEEYFKDEKWRGYHFREAEYGIPIVVYFKDLGKIIEGDFENGIELILGEIVLNEP